MGFTNSIKMSAMKTAFGYIEKNPEENLLKLLGWVDKLAGDGPDSFPAQRAAFRSVLENPDSNMYRLIMKDSVEERILSLQQSKADLAESILSGEEMSRASFTKDELLDILR